MDWIEVVSSNIKSIAFEPESSTLYVEFNAGNKYSYKDVPENEFLSFKDASSKGRFFQENIKGKYEYEKL